MKEIGKLLELFKEYVDNHGTDTKDIEKEYGVIDYGQGFQYGTREYLYEIIVSKKFGFIRWLVENDKIDFNKCGLDVRHYLSYNERYDKGIVMAENYDNDTLVREFYSPYKQLLMLLSIQDEPIRFLCEILK